jgi:uncharacterized membrane protein YdfJ with MMPL/SSD domain
MARLAGYLARRRWYVVGVWVVLAVVAVPLASKQSENLTGGGFDVPGSQSQRVQELISSDYPERENGAVSAVLSAAPDAGDDGISAGIDRLTEAVAQVPEFTISPKALSAARSDLADSGVAVVPLESDLAAGRQNDPAHDLRAVLNPGEAEDGVTPYLAGQPAAWAGLQELSQQDLEKAEAIGFPIVAIILLAVFGSLAAAALPLALGFASVLITGALIYLLSQQIEMSVFVTNMASMIGIGVAVDYSLFILARFREEVREGRTASDARARALSTSGVAVAFSGVAVIISLAGLWMIDNQTLRSMALGAMIVVAISILAATVLLPALIRVLGHRVEAGGRVWSVMSFLRRETIGRRRRTGVTREDTPTFWARWTERVMRRPVLSVLAVATFLIVLALPVLDMETGTGALDQFPPGHDVRVGNRLANEATGGAANAIDIGAFFDQGQLDDPQNQVAVDALARELRADHAVSSVTEPLSADGSALISAWPKDASDSDSASALVERIRAEIVPDSELAQRADIAVGGETARIVDIRDQIANAMPLIIAFILGFSFIVLMILLRSIILPLKAILMNLLSIGAAYGVLVIVFQWGWIDGFLGFESTGAIDTLTPPLVLAVVFGLSMDYEVFLLSRIRERYDAHGDNRRAVAQGLATSARTISSAALIMTSVFAVFVLTGVPSIKELGLGTAVAIALDATLVRLILVPAAMQLFGDWNWWLPKWLDRVIPRLDVEGGRSDRSAEQPAQA